MYRIKEIKKLLRSHDYAPIVRKVGDGVLLRVPSKMDLIVQAYAIRRGGEAGVFFNSNRAPKEHFISIPEYAIRLFIMADASVCCGRVPISDNLICYIDEEGDERSYLEEIVDPPSTEEDEGKEGFLTRLFIEAREDGFPREFEEVAETHGVYDGYRLIRAFFKG